MRPATDAAVILGGFGSGVTLLEAPMIVVLALSMFLQGSGAGPGSSPVRLVPGNRSLQIARIAERIDTSWITITANGSTRAGPLQIESIRSTIRNGRPALEHRILTEGRVRYDDTTWYDPTTLAPLAHRSSGPGRRFSLDYTAGRVRGSLEDSTGVHPIDVATGEVFDPSALHPLLRALVVEPGTYLLPFFNHEAGAVRIDTLIVEAEDRVDSDTGPIDVWRAVIAAQGRRATYYLRRSDGVELKAVVRFGPNQMTIAHRGIR